MGQGVYGVLLKGPRGSKGDTEGPRVTLPNHSVALQPETRAVLYFCGGGEEEVLGGSDKEEGEVEGEEERR